MVVAPFDDQVRTISPRLEKDPATAMALTENPR